MTSLFKGEISPWHGCVINLAAMAGVLWLLGLIGDIIFKKKSSSLALMILAGFSMGMVATTIWIRMYALLTLWTVWGLYLHIRKYVGVEQDIFYRVNRKNGKIKWLGSVSLFVVTLLSFWTQYFGLFFMIPLAVVTAALLLKDKRVSEFWAYVRTMVSAAVVGVGLYPFAIGDVLFSERGTEALSQWQNGFMEYVGRLKSFGSILACNVAGNELVFAAAILVPAAVILYHIIKKTKNYKQIEGWQIAMCGIPLLVYFLLAAKMSPYFVDRYIMAIFPITALALVWLWDCAMNVCDLKSKYAAVACITAAVFLTIISNINMQGQHAYLYSGYDEQIAVAEEYRAYPMVCLYLGSGLYENVIEMEQYEQTILLKPEELSSMDEARIEVTKDGYVALIKYPGEEAGKEQLKQVMDVFGGIKAELLYEGGAFGDAIYFVTGK
jgi:hypothetical protein